MLVDQLSQEWQDWLYENLARGCDQAVLAQKLVEGEVLSHASAVKAVREAFEKLNDPAAIVDEDQPRPKPHFEGSYCNVDGHKIRLLAEVAFPRILLLENVLSPDECEAFIKSGRTKLKASDVVSGTDGSKIKHPGRRGQYATFDRGETPLIAKLEQRIAKFTNWPVENGEGFQLIHYDKGDEYRPHFDWFDPALPGSAKHLKEGGQRIVSLIIYLNKPEAGGGTSFPKFGGLTMQPHPGSAVYFDNLDPSFAGDRLTLHAGDPIRAGEKWIATKWLRVNPHVGAV